ncbi:MAG: heterodisulfide reductase-related iron-sulfur binding cluster [Acidobacteriota bacterium]
MLNAVLEKETEKLLACVHCGLCLPACPTYQQLGNENDSPRGRIYLMRAVAEGKLDASSNAYQKHIDLCLGCRACETVCPSGVRFGQLLETARAELTETKSTQLNLTASIKRSFTGLVLKQIFTRPRLLTLGWTLAHLLQRSGFITLARETRLFRFAPQLEFALALLEQAHSQLPAVHALIKQIDQSTTSELREPPLPSRQVAQFVGCVMEGLFTETNRATTVALQANGCVVEQPATQVCCGALHAHSGFREAAIKLAKANIDAFAANDKHSDIPIIVNAAGCGAMLKEYGELLADDPIYAARAHAFSARVKDISEYLIAIGVQRGRPLPLRITYDAPCHLYHGQSVRQQPIELLRAIPGLDFVPLRGAEQCCGSAGIYNLTHPDLAKQLLNEKLDNIVGTGAAILITGNPGCAMHIGAGARLKGLSLIVLHPAELLALSYKSDA